MESNGSRHTRIWHDLRLFLARMSKVASTGVETAVQIAFQPEDTASET